MGCIKDIPTLKGDTYIEWRRNVTPLVLRACLAPRLYLRGVKQKSKLNYLVRTTGNEIPNKI
jgi:hypothetical protein